jgi:hypothetical protein
MTDPDRLAEIKARRAPMPDALDLVLEPQEEEYYAQFYRLEHGERDKYGHRDSLALVWGSDPEAAQFIANAPADIDWLIGEIERLEH